MNYWTAPSFYVENITQEFKQEKEDAVIKKVCDYYGITLEELKGSSRKRSCVIPRQVVSYILREFFNYGLQQVGDIVKKNHATIIYNVQTVKDLMDFDNIFRVEVNKLVNYAKFYTPKEKEEKLIEGKTSQYKGVSYHKASQRWRATVYLGNGKYKHLGTFKNELDAFEVYTKEKK